MRKIFSKACARAIQDFHTRSGRGIPFAADLHPDAVARSDLAGARAAALPPPPASPPASTSPLPGAKAMAERQREVRASLHQAMLLAVCFATPVT